MKCFPQPAQLLPPHRPTPPHLLKHIYLTVCSQIVTLGTRRAPRACLHASRLLNLKCFFCSDYNQAGGFFFIFIFFCFIFRETIRVFRDAASRERAFSKAGPPLFLPLSLTAVPHWGSAAIPQAAKGFSEALLIGCNLLFKT